LAHRLQRQAQLIAGLTEHTTPIHYLILIGEAEVLKDMFDRSL
jgi:hypothetical protein